jgi:hypothetical protein
MLTQLLNIVTPEALASAVRSNPKVVQASLRKFSTYVAFGDALSSNQQIVVSNNLDKLESFFKDDVGKRAAVTFVGEFCTFVSQLDPPKAIKAPLIEATDRAALRAQIEEEVRAEMLLKK